MTSGYARVGIHKAKSNSFSIGFKKFICTLYIVQSPFKTIDLGPFTVNNVKERKKSNSLNL
jgi:hypothetical protein